MDQEMNQQDQQMNQQHDYDEEKVLLEHMLVDMTYHKDPITKCSYVWVNEDVNGPFRFSYEFLKELFQAYPPGNPEIPEGYRIWDAKIGKTSVKDSDMIPFFDDFYFLPSDYNPERPSSIYHKTKFKTYSLSKLYETKIRDSKALFDYLFIRAETRIRNDKEFYDMYFKYLENKEAMNILFGDKIDELPIGDEKIVTTYQDGSTYNQNGEIVPGLTITVININDEYYVHYVSE